MWNAHFNTRGYGRHVSSWTGMMQKHAPYHSFFNIFWFQEHAHASDLFSPLSQKPPSTFVVMCLALRAGSEAEERKGL